MTNMTIERSDPAGIQGWIVTVGEAGLPHLLQHVSQLKNVVEEWAETGAGSFRALYETAPVKETWLDVKADEGPDYIVELEKLMGWHDWSGRERAVIARLVAGKIDTFHTVNPEAVLCDISLHEEGSANG